MLLEFLYALRRHRVPVSSHEWMTLMRGLELGLHGSSLDGLYVLARLVCVKQLAHFDGFDAAYLETFRGVEAQSLRLGEALQEWLREARQRTLSEEERALLQSLDPETLRRMFEERLREQKERHDGGSRWIGTGGTSPFGHGGYHPSGMAVGGGGQRSAMARAGERRYRAYRSDETLDVRRMDVALRLLRELGRDGAPVELDIGETVGATARNAGDLELVMRAPRRNRARLLLLMDVGGSMDPHSRLVSQLFTAASRAGRFARMRSLYFHNCPYDALYEDADLTRPVALDALLAETDRSEKLVIVGDAAMHPAELLQPGASFWMDVANAGRTTGLDRLTQLAGHFAHRAWLNPDPERYWEQTTVRLIRKLHPMFELTLDGLERAVRHLVRREAA